MEVWGAGALHCTSTEGGGFQMFLSWLFLLGAPSEMVKGQLYFKDDPFIDSDAWATHEMAVALEDDGAGGQKCQFDFVVDA